MSAAIYGLLLVSGVLFWVFVGLVIVIHLVETRQTRRTAVKNWVDDE